MRRTALFLLAAGFLTPVVAGAGEGEGFFHLVEGVVVDASREAVHLMRPGGGIESVAISSGTTNWASEDADKPLGIRGDLIVAQVEVDGVPSSLRVATLDVASGALHRRIEADLPPGIWGGIDQVLGRSFSVRLITGASGDLVSWVYSESYAKGIAPRPDEPPRSTEAGAYRLGAEGTSLVLAPAGGALGRVEAATLPPAVTAWAAAHPAAEAPAAVGGVYAATEVGGGMSSESGRITLKRWHRAGTQQLPDVELHRGPHILQLRSVDGRHVLIAEHLAPGELEEYEWSIFSLETGERIGRLRHPRSHAHFFVAGSTVVFVEPPYARRVADEIVEYPRRVRAAVLGSGTILWERDLRDTTYRGPAPP